MSKKIILWNRKESVTCNRLIINIYKEEIDKKIAKNFGRNFIDNIDKWLTENIFNYTNKIYNLKE